MADPWAREYGEAARLADDVGSMVAERGAPSQSGPEATRHAYASAIRRKITILGTRLESLEGLLCLLFLVNSLSNSKVNIKSPSANSFTVRLRKAETIA
jgi:hypothetical protein